MTFIFVTLAYYSARNTKSANGSDVGATAYDKGEGNRLTDQSEPMTASTTATTIYDSKPSLNETAA